ncbi:MAG: SRPBCC domain-containing protein [Vicingaceae bacterium]
MENYSVNASIKINATAVQVWNVLTNPEKISQFTGSKIQTDWKVGSAIRWTGEMQGTPYENKGKVLEAKPNSLLRHSFWTGMGGDADEAENYSEVSYTIKQLESDTVELIYSRINIATEMEAEMFQQHIQSMLEEIKRLSEE